MHLFGNVLLNISASTVQSIWRVRRLGISAIGRKVDPSEIAAGRFPGMRERVVGCLSCPFLLHPGRYVASDSLSSNPIRSYAPLTPQLPLLAVGYTRVTTFLPFRWQLWGASMPD